MKNRRIGKRSDLAEYVEVYERGTDHFLGHVVDLSLEGMRMVGVRPIVSETQAIVRMDLRLPGGARDGGRIAIEAAGVWCEEETNPDLSSFYNTGFRFMSLSAVDSRRLERLIEQATFRDWRRIPVY